MNNKLGPGLSLILGIVLLYTGGVSGGALGAGLSVGGLVCIVLAFVGGIKKLVKGSVGDDIESRTRSTARTLLASFLALRQKHNYSIESPTDKIKIYTHMLKLRGYNHKAVEGLIEDAEKISAAKGATQGISLNTLVYTVVAFEYTTDTHKELSEIQLQKVNKILSKVYGS